jgi:hypothetical protein
MRSGSLPLSSTGWRLRAVQTRREQDPLLSLFGSGKRLWAGEHADEYVSRLREGMGVSRVFWDTNLFIYL